MRKRNKWRFLMWKKEVSCEHRFGQKREILVDFMCEWGLYVCVILVKHKKDEINGTGIKTKENSKHQLLSSRISHFFASFWHGFFRLDFFLRFSQQQLFFESFYNVTSPHFEIYINNVYFILCLSLYFTFSFLSEDISSSILISERLNQ